MRFTRFLLLVSCFPLCGFAQQAVADSLGKLLSNTTQDTTRLSLMIRIGEAIYTTQPDSAIATWKRTVTEAQEKEKHSSGATLNALQRLEGNALNDIGFIYSSRGMTGPALEYNLKSFHLRESIGDKHGISESLNNIAFLYLDEHDTANALSYFERSAAGYEAIRDSGGIAFTMVNQGQILLARGYDSIALEKYSAAMKIFSRIPDGDRGYSSSVTGIGNVYARQGRYAEAMRYFLEGLAIREKNHDAGGIAGSNLSIARMYFMQGKNDSALFFAKKGYELALSGKSSESAIAGAQLLSRIYRQQGDFQNAFQYYGLYVAMRDSLSNEQYAKELVREQLNYDYAKRSAADSVKNADEIAVRDSKLAAEQSQKYALLGGVLLLLGFVGTLFNRFRVTSRQKNVIERQKKIVEEKQKEVLDSIQYATRIQQALLAGKNLLDENLPGHFVFYQPKDIVSGDFYWASALDSSFWLCVADCTGHGVPGAFMSLLNISFLNEAINEKKITSPAKIFDHIRERVIRALASDGSSEGGHDGMDAILCRFDRDFRTVEFACANNPLWLAREENGVWKIHKYAADKMPIGKYLNDGQPFTQHRIDLHPGDRLYLFSDGFADQFGGPKEKKYTYRRLEELLLANAASDPAAQEQAFREAFKTWKGNLEQIDDILLVGIKID